MSLANKSPKERKTKMECTFCEYYEATVAVMLFMNSVETVVCDRCEASLVGHYVVAELDTALV